jgi:carbon-monoxide dehydrogenase catalytic subunit
MAKKREIKDYSTDPAAQQMLIRAEELGIGTAFTRADAMVPCNIGGAGMCCKQCGMGPCRLTKNGEVGVCGATLDTIQARNLTRAIAAGGAAHSDHGRDMAFLLKATANGEAEGYSIRDVAKLRSPTIWRIYTSRSSVNSAEKWFPPSARRRSDNKSGANKTWCPAAWIVK